jgi:DNA polymerase/3'-5' exonuclease PolX
MSKAQKAYPLDKARAFAKSIVAHLEDVCERVEVVGSVRRQRARVHDIDILVLPKLVKRPADNNLFESVEVSLVDERLEKLVKDGKLTYGSRGAPSPGWRMRQYVGRTSGVPIDFYSSTPASWWTDLLIRTGSRDHNVFMTSRARSKGFVLHADVRGLEGPNGPLLELTCEEDVFRYLDLRFVPPQAREMGL